MDSLAPGRWRRRRMEELPAAGDPKRACRRSEAGGHECSGHMLSTCALVSWSTEDQDPRPRGPPAPRPECSQERLSSVVCSSCHRTHHSAERWKEFSPALPEMCCRGISSPSICPLLSEDSQKTSCWANIHL
ncbi:uncharacterized protein C10orf143 homolog isoform X2 [Acomys russatus]|uniref:uncharacterized protein C10orf143 homolog isoform X2 n=1 Tax=Acomys russatus TaxID=60746 RepID=UPI0021E23F04|nr:uncharacterized protein C10orf143 homolog isoform X2 [Acomys russatus]